MAAKMINTGQAEYLDMGWAYEELIPFLKEVFVGSEGMSTSAWERLILYARFNLDRIPVHEDFPSTIERLRLCLINAALLTSQELNKYMRIASMGPQTCVRIFVRHAIHHGPYPLHSLGNAPNPSFPRPQQDSTEQAPVAVIPRPHKPDAVQKLENEVKALTLKLEKYEGQLNQNRDTQNRQNQNATTYRNNRKNHSRPQKGQRTPAAGQDRKPPQPSSGYHMPFGHNHQQNPGMFKPPGPPMSPNPYNPTAFYQPYLDPSRMYGNSAQPYVTMPQYYQQDLANKQPRFCSGPVPTRAPHGWNYNQMAYSPLQPSFPSGPTSHLHRLQQQQTMPALRPTKVESDARKSHVGAMESSADVTSPNAE